MPDSSSVPHSRQKLSSIIGSIFPVILSVSLRRSCLVAADVDVSIGEYLKSFLAFLLVLVDAADEDVAVVVFEDCVVVALVDFDGCEVDFEAFLEVVEDGGVVWVVEAVVHALFFGLVVGGEVARVEEAHHQTIGRFM